MIDLNLIYTTIVAAVPALAAVISIIVSIVKAIRNNEALKGCIDDKMADLMARVEANTDVKKEYADLLYHINLMNEENHQLRKQLAELLTSITRIEHRVEELENEQRNKEV